MKIKATLTIAAIAISSMFYAQENSDHKAWGDLLKKSVGVQGNVNYTNFKRDISELDSYLVLLSENAPTKDWSDDAVKAYWINAYNANLVKIVINHFPINSINDVKGAFTDKIVKAGEKLYSLDYIEHKILRKMGDPMIVFGICKASKSSPKLSNMPFTDKNVNSRLDALATNFINDRTKNVITESSMKLSEVFKIYAKDFKKQGDFLEFINRYTRNDVMEGAKTTYMSFNWSLNK